MTSSFGTKSLRHLLTIFNQKIFKTHPDRQIPFGFTNSAGHRFLTKPFLWVKNIFFDMRGLLFLGLFTPSVIM
ncbi:MAG TPA: hypothetical protein DDW42_00340 [Desulfobacteraceae bacterium]|nr:hypothetical protein [Desulfobacteraceae bacterium]